MTEAKRLASRGPKKMLGLLRGRVSDRKLRLFACALFRALVARGTRFSENNHATIRRVEARPERQPPADPAGPHPGWADPLRGDLAVGSGGPSASPACRAAAPARSRAHQAALFRDIAGNPFRHAAIDPTWRTPPVTALAAVADEERALPSGHLDRTRLADLADALEKAGCSDPELLRHLRAGAARPRLLGSRPGPGQGVEEGAVRRALAAGLGARYAARRAQP